MDYFYKKINDPSLPYVLFLHGWGQSKLMMIPLANLCHDIANVVVLDLPGHGKMVLDKPFSIEDYVEWLSEFLNREEIKPSLIVGHSFGGKVASYYALNKEQVDLLLFAPSVVKAKFSLKLWGRIKVYKIFKKLLKKRIIKKIPKRYHGSVDYQNTEGALRSTFMRIVNAYPQKKMCEITSKVHVVWGKEDKTITCYQMKKLRKYLKNGTLTIVPGDHFAYLTNRKQMMNLIKCILKEQQS